MAARQRLCSWCGQPFVWGHPCDPPLAVPASDVMLSEAPKPRQAKPPKPPRYDRNNGVGAVARGIVVTPLGYSMVSPAVRARLAARPS